MTKRPSVLIVDDNQDLVQTFASILEIKGYDVEMAEDGAAAVDKFMKRHFDAVLMDIVMPRMDGIEAFQKMKEHNPEAKVILMTAYCEDNDMDMALNKGAFGTLSKPINLSRLLRVIKQATQHLSIIVVDDDEQLGRTLARALEVEGFQVCAVCRGEDAVKLAMEKPFQVALIDVRMPDMNGYETSQKLRAVNPALTNIMMTAYRDEARDTVAQALSTSAASCLYKPFDVARVLEMVSQIGDAS